MCVCLYVRMCVFGLYTYLSIRGIDVLSTSLNTPPPHLEWDTLIIAIVIYQFHAYALLVSDFVYLRM